MDTLGIKNKKVAASAVKMIYLRIHQTILSAAIYTAYNLHIIWACVISTTRTHDLCDVNAISTD